MKDTFLLLLSVIGFIVLLSLGMNPLWAIFILVYTVMLYLGFRYPEGVEDWSMGTKESAYVLVTIGSVLLIIYLIYIVMTTVTIPPANVLLTWVSALSIAALFIASLFFPKGFQNKA